MKNLAIAVAFALLLSACPMTGTTTPTTPSPTTPSPTNGECLPPATPQAPLPEIQPWTGQLPAAPPETIWVLAPLDDQESQWLLAAVLVEKKAVAAGVALTSDQVADVVKALTLQQVATPRAALAVLGSLRPIPQPGPPGEPALWRAFNAAAALHWSTQHPVQPKLEKPPVTHQ